MPWFKVDDGFWSHPKVIELSPASVALWVRAGSYSAQHLTGGFIGSSVVRMLGHSDADATALVDAGLWDGKPDGKTSGFEFHDWSIYQPSSTLSKENRDKLSRSRAESGRKGAEARWSQTGSKPDSNLPDALLSNSDSKSMAPSRPVPSPFSSGDNDDKLRETRLPKDWVPTAAHYERAKARGVDIQSAVESFRLHAETHDRHAARWNAAFTTWLNKSKPSEGDSWAAYRD